MGRVPGQRIVRYRDGPSIRNRLFGGGGLFLVQFRGPGRICLQSMPLANLAHALVPYLPTAPGCAYRRVRGSGEGASGPLGASSAPGLPKRGGAAIM